MCVHSCCEIIDQYETEIDNLKYRIERLELALCKMEDTLIWIEREDKDYRAREIIDAALSHNLDL